MSFINFAPLAVVGMLAATAAIQRARMASLQDARIKLARMGEEFIARKDVDPVLKQSVEIMLNDPFPCNPLVALAIPIVPFFVISDTKTRLPRLRAISTSSEEVRAYYLDILHLSRQITISNNPIIVRVVSAVIIATIWLVAKWETLIRASEIRSPDADGALLSFKTTIGGVMHYSPRRANHHQAGCA